MAAFRLLLASAFTTLATPLNATHTPSTHAIEREGMSAYSPLPTSAPEKPAALSQQEIEKIHRRIAERVALLKEEGRKQGLVATATPAFTPASGFDGLPAAKDGMFPVQIPSYNGVDQLLPLSNTWIVVATINLDEVSQEIAALVKKDPAWATIDFLASQQQWIDSVAAGRPNYAMRKKQIDPQVAKYAGQARVNIGEKLMQDPSYYTITSNDDKAYKSPMPPTEVTKFMVSLGAEQVPGFDPYYAIYSYLQMPSPLVDGKTYTITLNNGKSVTFTYDELTLVSRAVKVNQVGYLPSAKKFAYVGAYLQDLGPMTLPSKTTFSVVDAKSGQAVYTGSINLRASNPRFAPGAGQNANTRPYVSGENIYEMDFSPVTTAGTYFISVSGVGRSFPFTIDKNAYAEAFYTAARGMYHKRCGIELKKPYTPWLRIKCHAGPVYESKYVPIFFEPLVDPAKWAIFDIIGATMDKSKPTNDATGGWHDAGDFDKNLKAYANVFDMLALYDMKPGNFADNQLNIPESGDGIPDILNEAEYGIMVWTKSMTPEGGVSGFLETTTHPDISDPNYPYAFSLRTRWTSFMYAAAAAWYAQLVKPFSSAKASQYQALAIKAYTFAMNPKNSLGTMTVPAKTNRGTGTAYSFTFTENDYFNKPFEIAAKINLFILTGDKTYMDGVQQLLTDVQTPITFNGAKVVLLPGQWPFAIRDCSLSLYWCIFNPAVASILPANVITTWKGIYTKLADGLAALNDAEYYRRSRSLAEDQKMSWGMDVMTNHAKVLLFAYHLTQDNKYLQPALYNIDYMLGGNATSMSWTTGIGYVYPVPIHDRVSAEDGIVDPIPGIAIYGPNELGLQAFNIMWLPNDTSGKPMQMLRPVQYTNGQIVPPRLRNWVPHPSFLVEQNEFTVWETMSAPVFAYGYLLQPGWRAPTWLTQRKPRDPRVLFGQWYLP